MRKIIVVIFCLCFLVDAVVLAGGKEEKSIIQRKYLSGRTYFREGNYKLAVKQFETVVKMDPDYKVAAEYLKAAKAKLRAKSQKEAAIKKQKKGIEKAIKGKAERRLKSEKKVKAGWRRWLAKEEEKKRIKEEKKKIKREKKKEKAQLKRKKEIAHYYGLDKLEKVSQNAQDMITKAEKKKALQEAKESKVWAKAATFPSPKKEKAMARIYMARGSAAYKEGDYDKAIKEWEKVTALDPNNRAAQKRIQKVRQMIEKNRGVELEKVRREGIADAKVAVKKYSKRGKYLCQRKDYKGSIEEFQKVLAIDPGCKIAQEGILKAQKQLRAKEFKEAKVRRKIAVKVSKLVNKGKKYFLEKKYGKAKALALKALKLDPSSSAAKQLLESTERLLTQK